MTCIPGGSLNVVEGMILRGCGTQGGFTLRNMCVGVFVGKGTQEGLTIPNCRLFSRNSKMYYLIIQKITKGFFTYYIMNKGEGGGLQMIALHVILTINITTVKSITRGGRGLKLVKIDYIILCERFHIKHTILTYFTFLLYLNIFSTRN